MVNIPKIVETLLNSSQPIIILVQSDQQDLVVSKIKEGLQLKSSDLTTFDPNEGIKILRENLTSLNSRSFSGGLKMMAAVNAQNLSDEESNTLLKTMEEPSGHVRIILTTTSFSKILPTIKSRAQKIFIGQQKDKSLPDGLLSFFKKGDFNEFLKFINFLEKEDLLNYIQKTLDEIKEIGLNEGREELYKKLSGVLIKIDSSNSNPKLALESLFVWWLGRGGTSKFSHTKSEK